MTTMAVREPTFAEFEGMRDLRSVFAWAGLSGDISLSLGPAGALTQALHGQGFEQRLVLPHADDG